MTSDSIISHNGGTVKQFEKLGQKLLYLRTREKRITQTVLAEHLQVRQATVSNLEQGGSLPSIPLLMDLCTFFDVTPTYLLDDETPLIPTEKDRWNCRNALVAVGQYLEVPNNALHELESGSTLVALLPGTPIYDEDAARIRAQKGQEELIQAYRIHSSHLQREEQALQDELDKERMASRLRRRGLSKDRAEKILDPGS